MRVIDATGQHDFNRAMQGKCSRRTNQNSPAAAVSVVFHSSSSILAGEPSMSKINALLRDERGASLVEYSILIGLIAAATITAIVAVGTWITTRWTTLKGAIG